MPSTKELVGAEVSKVRLLAVPDALFADSVTAEFTLDPENVNVDGLLASITNAGMVDPAPSAGTWEDNESSMATDTAAKALFFTKTPMSTQRL